MAFFTLIKIWDGAKISVAIISGTLKIIIPQKIKSTDGITDNAIALKRQFFLKNNIHTKQYAATSIAHTIIYTINAFSN